MRQQLEALEEELTAIEAQLTDPETAKDSGRLQALMRRYGELAPLVERYRQYKQLLERERQAREILATDSDEDLLKLAQEELDTIVPQRERFAMDDDIALKGAHRQRHEAMAAQHHALIHRLPTDGQGHLSHLPVAGL